MGIEHLQPGKKKKKEQSRAEALLPQKTEAQHKNFFRSTTESILSQCCIVWYSSCTVENRKDLSQVVKTAQRIVGAALLDLDSVYADRLQRKVKNMSADVTHLGHSLFVPLPSA